MSEHFHGNGSGGGGCVVSPMIKLDGHFDNVLDLHGDRGITRRWGHHTLVYGNWRRQLRAFSRTFFRGFEPSAWKGKSRC